MKGLEIGLGAAFSLAIDFLTKVTYWSGVLPSLIFCEAELLLRDAKNVTCLDFRVGVLHQVKMKLR